MENNNHILFPIVMRISSKTIASDLIPVQPMSSPFKFKTKREIEIEKRQEKIMKLKEKLEQMRNGIF